MISNEEESTLSCSSTAPSSVAWGGAGMLVNTVIDNPWNKKKKEENLVQNKSSFKDLMSEELAKDLQLKEDQTLLDETDPNLESKSKLLDLENAGDTSNDLFLALVLQHDFNKQHDSQIQREEKHLNKNSKLSVSFSKYKVCPEVCDSDTDEDDYNQEAEDRCFDSFEESRRSDPVIPACGYIRHNNVIVTKHDKTLSGRRNAERVMNFPPGINTGDGGGFDMQISNSVYNKLARSAKNESKRRQRVDDKVDKATTEKALDPNTRLIIYKMVNNSILECVNGIISTGKESVVFHALGGMYEEKQLPSECAVKVFKTTLTDFKTREKYIRDDYRFKDRLSKNNNKSTIQLWSEKEFHNLRRLEKASLPSPQALLIKKHVLVMSFIGEKQVAAPKLKHVSLSYDQWLSAYRQVVDIMTTMFNVCQLVHSDLSEYNLLWFEDKCWVIDLGQAVEPVHKQALRFLHRDCGNVIRFFKSKGLADLPKPLKLFGIITDISLVGQEEEAARLIDDYEKNQYIHRNKGPCYMEDPFEFMWSYSMKEEGGRGQCDDEEDENRVSQDECEESKPEPARNERKPEPAKRNESKPEPARNKNKKKKMKRKKAFSVLVSDDDKGPELEMREGRSPSLNDFVYVESKDCDLDIRESVEGEREDSVSHEGTKGDVK